VTGLEQYLLNPALKNHMPGEELPVANHYKCYTCTGNRVDKLVFLRDQFSESDRTVVVQEPLWLCNPTKKTIVGGPTYDVVDENQHYVCYRIQSEFVSGTSVAFTDQFLTGNWAALFVKPSLPMFLRHLPDAGLV
jgi:hypothetical protein